MLSLKFLDLFNISARWKRLDPGLVRILIGTHHGHGRVLPPICRDTYPIRVTQPMVVQNLETDSRTDYHRFDSSWANDWNSVNQRYGYWQVAYLEAILRLSDWFVSGAETL